MGNLRQPEQGLDHLPNLRLFRLAVTDHRAFDLQGRVLVDRQAVIDPRQQRGAASMAELERGEGVIRQEDLLDRHRLRGVVVR